MKHLLITILIFSSQLLSHECPTINPADYGECEMILGWSWTGEDCDQISGCSTVNSDGIDDSNLFYNSEYICFFLSFTLKYVLSIMIWAI